jgi:hypothetical protein
MTMIDEVFDLTGEALVLEHRPRRLPEAEARVIPRLDVRMKDLIAVRESCVYDHVLMEGCVQHTLSYCKDVPGYQTAHRVGLDPLLAPQRLPNEVATIQLSHRKTKAVLWTVDGTGFLYSEASAASTDTNGDNQWTLLLTAALERLRPERLHVVALSRLVRSFEMSGLVTHAVSTNVDEVKVGGQSIRLRGDGSQSGQLLWSILTTISSSERNLIVQRLTAGVVAKFQRGQWVRGVASQPLGYVYDEETKTLRVDGSKREQVALAWTLLADPTVTVEKLVRILADAGVSTPAMLKRAEGTTVGDMNDPASFVHQIYRYADLYRTGVHVQCLKNPFPGAEHISTLPVLPATSKYPDGYLEFVYDWGVPAGGWVDDDVIATALAVRHQPRNRQGGRSHKRVAPLAGVRWTQDGFEYMLQGLTSDSYELRIRPSKVL